MLIIKEGRATLTEEAVTYKKHADGTYHGHLYMQHGQLYTGQKRHGNYSCYKQHGQRKHGTNLSTCTGTMARGSMEPICPLVQAAWLEEAWNQSVHLYRQHGQRRHGNNLFTCTCRQHCQRKHGTNLFTCTGSIARGSMEPICPLVQAALPEEA